MPHHAVQTLSTPAHLHAGPLAAAVVIPTVARLSLVRAVRSVYAQDIEGGVQVLIGLDKPLSDSSALVQIERECPPHCLLTLFDLGYSTSRRHGGLHAACDGGALRTILSYAAHSRYVAYLDDDNWWAPQHLSSLRRSIEGVDWAFSLRWYVDPQSQKPVCVDEWESLGPDAGCFRPQFGGFVDPSCLMIDKQACEPVLRWWSVPLPDDEEGMSADRNVLRALQPYRWHGTDQATAYYTMHPADVLHPHRQRWIEEKRRSASSLPSENGNEAVAPPLP